MATPDENTEVVRMLRDFRNAVSGTPYKFNKPAFFSNRKIPENKSVATKLNFTDCFNSTLRDSSPATVTESAETPEMLKRKLMSRELELQASKAALQEKEAAITLMEPANKRICLNLEQKMEDLRRKNQADVSKIVQLSSRLKYLQNESSMAKSRVFECEKEKKLECDKLQMEILATQRECSHLKFEIAEVKSETAETVRKLNSKISRLELEITAHKEESRSSKEFIQSLKKQVNELTEKASKSISLQEELLEAQKKITMLENDIAKNEDSTIIVKSLQLELPELRNENQILKEELSKYKENNVSLFQEKMWAFQEKLSQAEKKNVELVKLQVENESLRNKLSEWDLLYDDLNVETRSPAALSKRLSTYQKNELLLMNKLTKISAHCDTLKQQNTALEANVKELKKSSEADNKPAISDERLFKRMRMKISLLTKERDSCRQLIDSYTSDCTMSNNIQISLRFKNFEDTIEEYKKLLEKYEEDIVRLEAEVKNKSNLNEENAKYENLIKSLQDENSVLVSKVKDLESRPSTSTGANVSERIVHLLSNPLSLANRNYLEDVKNLREENDVLKKRVAVLEEEGAAAMDVTVKVQQKLLKEGSDTTLQELQDKLASLERKNKLIIDTARSQSKEFREAVYHLTGYNVDRQSAGKYKLAHVYAESPDDFLLFEVNAQGVQLLETIYSASLVDLMETYLHSFDSFPAFLASLTMDLFKQQTYMLSHQTITIS